MCIGVHVALITFMSYDWIRNKTNTTGTTIGVRVALITFMRYDWIRNKTNSTGTTIRVRAALITFMSYDWIRNKNVIRATRTPIVLPVELVLLRIQS
jgi:hypothetical protein